MDSLPVEIVCIVASHLPQAQPGYRDSEVHRLEAFAESQHATAGLASNPLEHAVHSLTSSRPVEESVPKPRLAPFATISRKWQHAVERLLFDGITFTNAEIEEFNSIFSAGRAHRCRFLKHANLRIILPASCEDPNVPFESESARLAKNKCVSEAVWGLFNTFSAWNPDSSLSFDLSIAIPTTKEKANKHQYVYLSVEDVEKLPVLPFIRELNISWASLPGTDENIQFHPATIIGLNKKAPGQQALDWSYAAPGVYFGLRRQFRNAVIESLQTVQISPVVRKLSLCACTVSDTIPHDQQLPNLVDPHQQDPLCSTIHRLINNSNIRELWMEAQIDSSLFWPYPDAETPQPFWQSIESLHVGYPIEAPNGRWYFQPPPGHLPDISHSEEPLPAGGYEPFPPGYGTLQETCRAIRFRRYDLNMRLARFRTMPNDDLVAPLLISFARAISQMPLLKSAILWNNLMEEPWSFNVEYRAPGYQPEYDKLKGGYVKHNLSKPRVIFELAAGDPSGHDWKPSDDIIEMFRNVSIEAHYGKAEIISWWDWDERDQDDETFAQEEEEEDFSDEEHDFGDRQANYYGSESDVLNFLEGFLNAPPQPEDFLPQAEQEHLE